MIWTTLDFSIHQGLSLPQVLFKDPDWFFWMMENKDAFRNHGALRSQAIKLQRRATSIRIPGAGQTEELQIEHMIHHPTRKYAGFIVVPASKPLHQGSSETIRTDHLDMSFPRQVSAYDKTGSKLLIKSMKPVFFGRGNARLTKERCEAFFNEESNFQLG